MITTKTDIETYRLSETDPRRLSAIDVKQSAARVPDYRRDAYIIHLHDGSTEESRAEMIFFPDTGRAGIAWGGDADWFDADSAEEAAELWVSSEWRDYE